MGIYTTELRFLIDSGVDLGLNNYPIFDENYRETLNNLIKKHFYFHEIGFETVDRFVFELNNVMREIMPLYNQYYNAELLTFDPFEEFSKVLSTTETHDQNVFDVMNSIADSLSKAVGSQTNSATIDSTVTNDDESFQNQQTIESEQGENVGSDTPRNLLAQADIRTNVYATNASKNESNSDSNINQTINNTGTVVTDSETAGTVDTTDDVETSSTSGSTKQVDTNGNREIESTESGHNQSKTDLLVKLREAFINVDQMVLMDEALNNCFMRVFN